MVGELSTRFSKIQMETKAYSQVDTIEPRLSNRSQFVLEHVNPVTNDVLLLHSASASN
jgi:hypothetical protein